MNDIKQERFEAELSSIWSDLRLQKNDLFEPCEYLLSTGGKRIRPLLVFYAHELFSGKNEKGALSAALSIELFHNYTLMHDDIMDDAEIRRGKPSVYKKFGTHQAILSGDALLTLAYMQLENINSTRFLELYKVFNKVALEVAIGQQDDIAFESRAQVLEEEYLEMIKNKTSVLLGAALQMGAIIADVSHDLTSEIYDFGVMLGLAFQLQDDYLDTFGKSAKVGKIIGGDILENKKTILYIKALELASENQKERILHWYAVEDKSDQKIKEVTSIFKDLSVDQILLDKVKDYSQKAREILLNLSVEESKKQPLLALTDYLLNRTY